MLLRFFENKSDWKITFYDLNDSSSLEKFLNITKTLIFLRVQVLPPDLCLSCEMENLTLDEILTVNGQPLLGFFRDGRLTAITIGIVNYETLAQALMVKDDEGVRVFTPYEVHHLSDKGVRTRLEEFFIGEGRSEIEISNVILSIILLALADSVNPCTFALFTALLLITLHYSGKMRVAVTGFSFISAIFIGYYILGLGVFQILVAVPHMDKALAILGLVLGALNVVRGLKLKFKSPIPKSLRRFMELKISGSYTSVAASFGLGLISSLILLPCSGGPYMVFLGLLSALKGLTQAYLLLAFYNLLFLMPLIFILVAVLMLNRLARKIKVFRSTKLGIMEMVSGALLTIMCLYILFL